MCNKYQNIRKTLYYTQLACRNSHMVHSQYWYFIWEWRFHSITSQGYVYFPTPIIWKEILQLNNLHGRKSYIWLIFSILVRFWSEWPGYSANILLRSCRHLVRGMVTLQSKTQADWAMMPFHYARIQAEIMGFPNDFPMDFPNLYKIWVSEYRKHIPDVKPVGRCSHWYGKCFGEVLGKRWFPHVKCP